MLTHLSIRNIVLITQAEIAFTGGLCVLTGETGAGKSILLDSLGLALGARADISLIRQGEAQGSVTAEFDISGNAKAKETLEALEIPVEDALIIRRSVSADGKSRVLVNDAPLSVTGLKRLGEALIEIHGQHDQKGLMDAAIHRQLLDAFGKHAPLLREVAEAYRAWREAEGALVRLQEDVAQSRREEDYLRHMVAELSRLNPEAGEEERLSLKRAEMQQGEKQADALRAALSELQTGRGVEAGIRGAQRLLMRMTGAERCAGIIEALERAGVEVEEAIAGLERLSEEIAGSPQALDALEERLFALKNAARKYGLPAGELLGLKEEAESKLARLESRDAEAQALEKTLIAAKAAYAKVAGALFEKRLKASERLGKAIHAELEPLKMGGARFRARVEALPEAQWAAHGQDAVAFEAATNVVKGKDITFSALSKIASGGELSRFMLAVKVALSEVHSTPTLIFDEIDTGTGGAVADAIGARLARLAEGTQVLVVTHLPQVAARGAQHVRVRKEQRKGAVHTQVEELNAPARTEELARMLSGSTITPEARKAAEKLLEGAA